MFFFAEGEKMLEDLSLSAKDLKVGIPWNSYPVHSGHPAVHLDCAGNTREK